MSEAIKEFIKEHGIQILTSDKRTYARRNYTNTYFTNTNDCGQYSSVAQDYYTEPLYTIDIAESELRRIAEFEANVFNNLKTSGHFNLFNVLMEQRDKERRLREKYPTVRKLYEQYSAMLALVSSDE